ncbi:MAG: hypothetical protein FJW22_12345 [Acidimicrobiia bacterium]|nr:hypothetical protein [Acidimicrobiia bacterium]
MIRWTAIHHSWFGSFAKLRSINNESKARIGHVHRHGCHPGENTRMNDARYTPSGTIHNSGTGAMSVVIWAVTASSINDGTRPSAVHRRRWRAVIGTPGASGGTAAFPDAALRRWPTTASSASSTIALALHARVCCGNVRSGSTISGHAIRPAMLPALLAVKSGYGSRVGEARA